MSLDTKNMFGGGVKTAGRVFANPMCMALMISIIIMIIVTYSHDDEHKFRTSFRVFFVTLLFTFMNNHVIMAEMNDKLLSNDQKFILDDITTGVANVETSVPFQSFVVHRTETDDM